jgi:protein phosphatase methylesterase 1
VLGVVNLDVVEGTAMEFLGNMMQIIESRPKGFASLEDAIAWQ